LILSLLAAWMYNYPPVPFLKNLGGQGWPRLWQKPAIPPKIQEVQAVNFPATSYLSSTASTKITSTVSWQIVTTAPASSNVATTCAEKKTTGYCQFKPGVANGINAQPAPTAPSGLGWIYDTVLDSTIPAGTWTFNVTTKDSSGTGTGNLTVCAWKVSVSGGAITASSIIFSTACVDGTTNIQAFKALTASSVTVSGVATTSFSNTQYLYVEYWLHTTKAGSGPTAKDTFEANTSAESIVLPGASSNLPPSSPSQDSPANNATGVSVTPTFLMTATDPESNNLGYKVTIYSESTCTTVVQTNDQAVSSAGWTGTNATCTGAPTSCYTSGTQGSFLTQTALANSTQYWWKASAKDPDGSGTFTNSSTCNTFTTQAAPTLSFSISDLTIGFGTWSGTELRYATGDEAGSTTEPGAGLPTQLTASTNAANGLVITIRSTGDGTSAGLYKSVSPTKLISAVASSTVAAGSEGYGVYGKAATGLTIDEGFNNDGVSDLAISTSALRFAYTTAPVTDGVVDVSSKAAITATTPTGSYSDALTLVCTGTF